MPVLHSGTWAANPPVIGAITGPWNHANFPPFGMGYGLSGVQTGTIEMSLVSGTTLIATSADGTFDVAAAPAGFTPTTLNVLSYSGHATTRPGDLITIEDVGVVSGAAPLALPDNRLWAFLRTDLFRLTAALADALSFFAVNDPETNNGLILGGHYDLIAYWWTIPEVDACGNRRDPHFQLAFEDPGAPWERLDPLDPDAAPAPTILSVEPDHGPIAGGTAVTIRGSGFGDACSVEFDGVPATSIITVSATEITCVAPAHLAGNATVVVINEDGVTS
jgi:hypothetical protein